MDKPILNAGLNKLVKGEDVEDAVADINEILGRYSNHSDEIALHQMNRRESRLLRDAQELLPLEGVSHYRGSNRRVKNGRIITYSTPEAAVEIHFRKKKAVFAGMNADEVVDAVAKIREGRSLQEMIKDMEDGRHFKEEALGDEAKTLDNYFLERVDVLTPAPLKFRLGIPPWTTQNRKTVYKA